MDTSILGQISALGRMSVAELRGEWLRLYGEPARSTNRQFLFRRLAWRIQELQQGGLSDHAKARLEQLAADHPVLPTTGQQRAPGADPAQALPRPRSRRDPRLPSPGTVITKTYKGRELRVTVHEDGLELDGAMYPSATALAKAITGSKSINGWLFLGLTKRKRG